MLMNTFPVQASVLVSYRLSKVFAEYNDRIVFKIEFRCTLAQYIHEGSLLYY